MNRLFNVTPASALQFPRLRPLTRRLHLVLQSCKPGAQKGLTCIGSTRWCLLLLLRLWTIWYFSRLGLNSKVLSFNQRLDETAVMKRLAKTKVIWQWA